MSSFAFEKNENCGRERIRKINLRAQSAETMIEFQRGKTDDLRHARLLSYQTMVRRKTMPLRERLEWLIEAAQARRYGAFLDTTNTTLATDYVAATGQSWKKESCGRVRARLLSEDLRELVDRGILTRTRATSGYVYMLAKANCTSSTSEHPGQSFNCPTG